MLYKRKTRKPDGTVVVGKTWWIIYYKGGKAFYESTGTEKETRARQLLKKREGEIIDGKLPGVLLTRIRFDELADDLLNDYKINQKKSLERLEASNKHLEKYFKGMRIADITTARVRDYSKGRLEAGAKNATINRELAALKRMLNLATESTPPKIGQIPHIPMLKESNVRQGFFEHDDYLKLMEALPFCLKSVVTFAYKTGWRKSEILNLT